MSPAATRTMRLENRKAGRHRPDDNQWSVLSAQLTETRDMMRFCRDRADQFKRNGLGNILDRRSRTSTPTSLPRRGCYQGVLTFGCWLDPSLNTPAMSVWASSWIRLRCSAPRKLSA
jgi:hypothetical protein